MGESKYRAREPDATGVIHYSSDDHQVWHDLMARQSKAVKDVACSQYLHGLTLLDLPPDQIPQLEDVSSVLRAHTGWEVAQVPALIPFDRFFDLLAHKQFPCATFIRTREDMDYLQEPDLFHEIYGHCAMLTNPFFAEFTQTYGRLGYGANKEDRVFLARLYWFTVEFGLLQTARGLKIYGGGILSSIGETEYCLTSTPEHRDFNIMDVLRTPYRIDIMQPIYYVLEDMKQLFDVARSDIMQAIRTAKQKGLFAPTFPAAPAMKHVS
ncbi:phenylalanine 4-monooxygenase [Oleiphilus messinensis]|uniref:Phenylalanine-4-hydroxylase n=1 Tax=Oleiphilus messinensis TaxID=141451 RepID=A0A1Y0IGD6_9GAMM|nr:phenylalanine 4-monooxygenase [Oleiphilus messinensis]ARU59189.1 phenylalanine 4-monooxygenase [Oleiphilus messinensis]